MPRTSLRQSATRLLMATGLLAFGCETIEEAPPRPRTTPATTGIVLNIPPMMRGTVGASVVVLGHEPVTSPGYRPIAVRGYGLVVGLQGTGSRDIPPTVRAHMLTEMARMGVGQPSSGWGHVSPEAMLDSPNTAVVIVEAIIPPASMGRRTTPPTSNGTRSAGDGTRIDVRVTADPRTGTTSLEGGTLWTTELRPGLLRSGSRQARILARASGPIFINPFVDVSDIARVDIDRLNGRILNGGEVLEDMPLKLMIIEPGHRRASIIQNAINRRFPREPGQPDPTARGTSDATIVITVPPSWRDRPEPFIRLLRHTTIRQVNAEQIASSIRRLVLEHPEEADAAALRWEALGSRSLPFVRDLYDHVEDGPRLAALKAGAGLGDPLAAEPLLDMAAHGRRNHRLLALRLLRTLPGEARIGLALHELLDDPDVEVRLRAYEALVARGDPLMRRYDVDGRFHLDVVESKYPMIYITQTGASRIVLFGRDLALDRPLVVSAWSDRLMIKESPDGDSLEVFYRPAAGVTPVIWSISPRVEEFIRFLGRSPSIESREPGLGLSYSRAVGALHAAWRQDALACDFKVQQDRVLAELRRLEERPTQVPRPEFAPVAEAGPTTGADGADPGTIGVLPEMVDGAREEFATPR